MLFESPLLTNLVAVWFAFLLLWCVSLKLRDASIADLFWGVGFVLVAWLSVFQRIEPLTARPIILTALVSTWGVRLSVYLMWRNWGKGEDRRYQTMRARHRGNFPWLSLVTVFGLQALLMWIVSLPIQFGIIEGGRWSLFPAVGSALWAIGFLFESVGDYQLARFKAQSDNRGQVMDRGLWRYTRHPNYFGDFLVWWGFYLIAVEPAWWWTIVSPLVMSLLLIRISGVRLLEDSLKSRVTGYDEYVRRTSPFFPLPPQKQIPQK